MAKRSKKQFDPSEIARHVLDTVVPDAEPPKEKNPAAVALGRLGGLKGGAARAAKLTVEQRKEIAKNAAKARWGNKTTK
ncbi:MAG: hypothetical protein LLF97_10480 [Planctomycetaceae bacterium]|nr:hypothetical protein [Planctomycetaceae bacterium]